MTRDEYPVLIESVPEDEGGGFLAIAPDLPGCVAEGKTREDAARAITKAIAAWLENARQSGSEIPEPSEHLSLAGE
jgi:predicted RNase H-like HicB family nuclease